MTLRLAAVVLIAGCRSGSTPPPAAPPPAAQPKVASLDARVPVPLLPVMAQHQRENMRDHLLAVQQIVLAASTDDFTAVERAALRLGYSDHMGQMCSHMGAGAPGFTEQAIAFHRTADGITAAAQQKDRAAVLASLGATLEKCTGCHAAWRQHVVTEAEWSRLTAQAPPQPHHPH